MKNIKSLLAIAWVFLVGCTATSCSDTWTEHYDSPVSNAATTNLWERIKSNSDLSQFASILEKTGYDKILSQSQAFTVWAPTNSSLSSLNIPDSLLENEFVDNHIADYTTSASGIMSQPIKMLNGKVLKLNSSDGINFYLGDVTMGIKNQLAKNGILHTLSGYEPFQSNIWEYLAKNNQLSNLKNYLYSFNNITFSPTLSVPGGGYDDDGNVIYLDSVYVNNNIMFNKIGQINREDSSYTMVMPTNAAWAEKYRVAKSYYKFYNSSTPVADSLQATYAQLALVQNLVFSNTMQLAPNDSLISTNGVAFKEPAANLLSGAFKVNLSNGIGYVTDSLRFKPSDSWHLNRLTEAESILNRENTYSSIFTRDTYNSEFEGVSGDKYIETVPSTTSSNPTVIFTLPSTLSAKYNVYCVFLPETLVKSDTTEVLSFKVAFQLIYQGANGATVQSSVIRPTINTTNKSALTKMLVLQNFQFPVVGATYDSTTRTFTNTTKLKVISDVKSTELKTYSRNLLIDCIIFEPVD